MGDAIEDGVVIVLGALCSLAVLTFLVVAVWLWWSEDPFGFSGLFDVE